MGEYGYITFFPDSQVLSRGYHVNGLVPPALAEAAAPLLFPPRKRRVPLVLSPHGSASGWVVELPLTSRHLRDLPRPRLLRRIDAAARMAGALGANLVSLGFPAELVRGSAAAVSREAGIPVITGSGYDLAVAVDAIAIAAQLAGLDVRAARVAVIGLPCPAGEVCAHLLARKCLRLTLNGRPGHSLSGVAASIMESTGLSVRIIADAGRAVSESDIVLVAGASDWVYPGRLEGVSVVCDLRRSLALYFPAPAPAAPAGGRGPLVIDGGVVQTPSGTCVPSLAAAMMLAMEDRNVTRLEGAEPSVAEADEMTRLASRHGFVTAGPARFGRLIGSASGGTIGIAALP